MSLHGHYRIICSCGQFIEGCKCPELNKPTEVLQNGCPACKAANAPAPPATSTTPEYGAAGWKTALLVGRQRTPDGKEKVMLIMLRDDTLQVAAFITAEQADQLAEQLMSMAAQIRTGLVIPPKGRISV